MRIDERELFESVMMGFMLDEDPMLAMLKWIKEQLMQIEDETKAGANNGVFTRKIERLAKEMGIENIYASQVSNINKGLDEQVEAFKNRPLQAEYPFIYVDALYEKIRSNKRVVSTAVMIAYGVRLDGKREVLAVGHSIAKAMRVGGLSLANWNKE